MLFIGQKGQSGISTLIIFIAMILVAAIAALVLIQTSDILQSQAQQVGSEAARQSATNLHISGITAKITSADGIGYIRMTANLSVGSPGIDLNDLIIQYSTSNAVKSGISWRPFASDTDNTETNFTAKITTAPREFFDVRFLGEPDDYSSKKIQKNQQIEIWYNAPDANSLDVVTIQVMPTGGTPTLINYTVPVSLSGNFKMLYP